MAFVTDLDEFPWLGGFKVLVAGDPILDYSVFLDADRVGREAPAIVYRHARHRRDGQGAEPGGALYVASLLASWGAAVRLACPSSRHHTDDTAVALAARHGVQLRPAHAASDEAVAAQKVRYWADRRLAHRIDTDPFPLPGLAARVADAAVRELGDDRPDVVVVSDYRKGAFDPDSLRLLLHECRVRGVPVVIDSRHGISDAHGDVWAKVDDFDDSTWENAARRQMAGVVATQGERGLVGFTPAGGTFRVHAALPPERLASDWVEPTGCGDVVTACLAASRVLGWNLRRAAELAAATAGVNCLYPGAAVLKAPALSMHLGLPGFKVKATVDGWLRCQDIARRMAARSRSRFARGVGFTNGCFDLLHAGHLGLLRQLRRHCDLLVVGINSDASVRRLKGDARPIQPYEMRARQLAELPWVTAVVPFHEDTPERLLAEIRPDVLGRAADSDCEAFAGESHAGEVLHFPKPLPVSTTLLASRPVS